MKNHIGLYIKFHKENDADIIDYLNGVDNKQGLIKKLIRRSMISTKGKLNSCYGMMVQKAASEDNMGGKKQHEGLCKRN